MSDGSEQSRVSEQDGQYGQGNFDYLLFSLLSLLPLKK